MPAATGRKRRTHSYTANSITRALDVHLDAGRIRNWRGTGGGRFVVSLNRADDLELRSLREAWVFVAGLASAHMAPERGSAQATAARFEQLGRDAFAAGLACTPTVDPVVFDTVAHLSVGGGAVEIMGAWTRGWTAANLAAVVEA